MSRRHRAESYKPTIGGSDSDASPLSSDLLTGANAEAEDIGAHGRTDLIRKEDSVVRNSMDCRGTPPSLADGSDDVGADCIKIEKNIPHGILLGIISICYSQGIILDGAYLSVEAMEMLLTFMNSCNTTAHLLEKYKIDPAESSEIGTAWTLVKGAIAKAGGKAVTMAINIVRRTLALKLFHVMEESIRRDCMSTGGRFMPSKTTHNCAVVSADGKERLAMGFALFYHVTRFFQNPPDDFAPDGMIVSADFLSANEGFLAEKEWKGKMCGEQAAYISQTGNMLLITAPCLEEAINQQRYNHSLMMERFQFSRREFKYEDLERALHRPRDRGFKVDMTQEERNVMIKDEREVENILKSIPFKMGSQQTVDTEQRRLMCVCLGSFIKFCCSRGSKGKRLSFVQADGLFKYSNSEQKIQVSRSNICGRVAKQTKVDGIVVVAPQMGTKVASVHLVLRVFATLHFGSYRDKASESDFRFSAELRTGEVNNKKRAEQFDALVRLLKCTLTGKRNEDNGHLITDDFCIDSDKYYALADFATAVAPIKEAHDSTANQHQKRSRLAGSPPKTPVEQRRPHKRGAHASSTERRARTTQGTSGGGRGAGAEPAK